MLHFSLKGILLVIIISTSCSQRSHDNPDISGLYSHLKGTQNYYILTIDKNGNNNYNITLEGIPLKKQAQGIPWNLTCTGQLQDKKIHCDTFLMNFSVDYQSIKIIYDTNDEQTFISTKKEFEEDIKIYE